MAPGSIHGRGLVGHVEEISVAKEHQGKGLGLKIIQALDGVGKNVGCYKNILNCGATNEPFYVRINSCGSHRRRHPHAIASLGQTAEPSWARDRSSADTTTPARKCRITLNRPRTTSIEGSVYYSIIIALFSNGALCFVLLFPLRLSWDSRLAIHLVFLYSSSQSYQSPHHAAATIFLELSPTSNVYRPLVIITQFCSSTSQ